MFEQVLKGIWNFILWFLLEITIFVVFWGVATFVVLIMSIIALNIFGAIFL